MNKDKYNENYQHGSVANRSEYETAALYEPVCAETPEAVLRWHETIKRYEIERIKRYNERL